VSSTLVLAPWKADTAMKLRGGTWMKMRLKAFVALGAVLAALGAAGAALADQPPGLRGYEGHPGNQGGPQHHP